MVERPIIFSGSMVRALLDGRKTMTRRLLKLPKDRGQWEPTTFGGDGSFLRDGTPAPELFGIWNTTTGKCIAPKWQPGDRLWVREAWRTTDTLDKYSPAEIAHQCAEAGYLGPWAPVLYVADNSVINWEKGDEGRRRASMHMPRWASRITLAVTAVRVERLQDITIADALAEGALESGLPYVGAMTCDQARIAFSLLWDSLHGKLSWEENPWIVVISFERVNG